MPSHQDRTCPHIHPRLLSSRGTNHLAGVSDPRSRVQWPPGARRGPALRKPGKPGQGPAGFPGERGRRRVPVTRHLGHRLKGTQRGGGAGRRAEVGGHRRTSLRAGVMLRTAPECGVGVCRSSPALRPSWLHGPGTPRPAVSAGPRAERSCWWARQCGLKLEGGRADSRGPVGQQAGRAQAQPDRRDGGGPQAGPGLSPDHRGMPSIPQDTPRGQLGAPLNSTRCSRGVQQRAPVSGLPCAVLP